MKKFIILFFSMILLSLMIASAQTFESPERFQQQVNEARVAKGNFPIEFTGVNCDPVLLSSVEYFNENLTIKGHSEGKYNQWFGWAKCDYPKITSDLIYGDITAASVAVARYHYDTYDLYDDGTEELVKRDTYYAIVVVWE
jgi:hypothetical protein